LRKCFATLILALFFLSLLLSNSLLAQSLTKVYVDGSKLGVYPLIKQGVAYLPANTLAQSLGVRISWSAKTRILKLNNQVVAVSPLVTNGKLYLPVEAIAAGAGATVEWDGASNAIRIKRSGSSAIAAAGKKVPIAPVNTPKQKMTPPQVKSTPVIRPVPHITAPKPALTYEPGIKNRNYKKSVPGPVVSHKPPKSYPGQPTKSAYPDARPRSNTSIRPKDAPPSMPSNLSLPPMSTIGSVSSPKSTYSSTSPFIPRSQVNSVFRVTVTNMEYVDSIKDYYKPKPGYKFIIVYLSQQNISDAVQIYTGRFSLLDQNNQSYDYIEGLSNFWLVILRPGGINFGYLVFEIPADSKPMNMVLHALNQTPLSIRLK